MTDKIGLAIANTYGGTPIKLDFAEDDAKDIKKALEERPYYEFNFSETLIDRNHTEVFKKIERVLKEANQNDTVLIYFSGHGKLDDEGKLCLIFNETEPESLIATSLPFEFINRFIKKSRCENIITVLDCCYSGAADERGEAPEKKIEENLEAASGSGKIILTSSMKYQTSKEDEKLKHGVFTNYLLEGLKIEEVSDEHGQIAINRLYNYAHKKTKDRNPDQEPLMKGTFKGEIIIGRNPKRIKEITYDKKIEKLIEMHSQGLPGDLYNEAAKILEKEKENLFLNDIERKIKEFLEDLLNDRTEIQVYIKTIEKIKKCQPIPSSQNSGKKKQRIGNVTEISGKQKGVKKYCPNCGRKNEGRLNYCTQCGAKLTGTL